MYMNQLILALMVNSMELNVQEWKEFRVGTILQCDSTMLSIKDELSDGNIPFVSRTAENNGIDGFVDVENDKVTNGNCLTIGAEGIYAFYQPDAFATGNKVYQILYIPKATTTKAD